jgi:hypothetical protein
VMMYKAHIGIKSRRLRRSNSLVWSGDITKSPYLQPIAEQF